ncbi:MAG: recombinase family protein [Cyanobacterium sp. T60_A2020_053]|nr:recombinase family protein [Cyanobacterium sp. T60_A2020_053]
MSIIVYSYIEPSFQEIPSSFCWGLEVDKIYQDIGSRYQLDKLFADCQQNPPQYLLIQGLEELGDNLAEVWRALDFLESLSVEIIAVNQPYNSSQFKVIGSEEKREKLTKIWRDIEQKIYSHKLKKSHAEKRLRAHLPPGKAPYGYQRGQENYLINRATAPIIRSFFERFLLYASLTDSVNYIKRKYNKKIALSTALNWLKNPVYRGDLAHKNKTIMANTHTAIISREESAQIERILKSHRRFSSRSTSARHCLAGLIKCQTCDSLYKINQVNQKRKEQKYLYLTPVQCFKNMPCPSLIYEKILKEIINIICQKLPQKSTNFNQINIEEVAEQFKSNIISKQQILSKLDNFIKENILDIKTAEIRKYQLNQEIVELKEKLAQLPPANLVKMSSDLALPQFWHDLSEPEKRFYLREFINQIYLDYNDNHELIINLEFVF